MFPAIPDPPHHTDANRRRDEALAAASDREWAALHGHVPGIWRVRPRVGTEGPTPTPSAPPWMRMWVLVHVRSRFVHDRYVRRRVADVRLIAQRKGLRPEDER